MNARHFSQVKKTKSKGTGMGVTDDNPNESEPKKYTANKYSEKEYGPCTQSPWYSQLETGDFANSKFGFADTSSATRANFSY